jgi:predicted hydrocarbon binding protein
MSESAKLWKFSKALHSKHCDIVRLLLQALAFVFAFFARNEYWASAEFWSILTLVSIGVAIALLILALIFRERYVIEYTLNPETGTLYDAKAGFPNVSLRVDTLNTILGWVLKMQKELGPGGPERVLYEAGHDVGRDFAQKLREHLKGKGRSPQDIRDPCRFLKRVLEYDSSSGMGKFSLDNCSIQPTIDLRINVLNAFTSHTLGACEFLRGYIGGACEEIFNKAALSAQEVSCVGKKSAHDGICRFHVTENVVS